MNIETKILTWDEWEEQFKPVRNTITKREEVNGWLFETFGKDEEHIRKLADNPKTANTVWTWLDTGNGLVIVNGWHYVNRFGYFITKVPFDPTVMYEIPED
jgi:hypothetical protein